MAESCSHKIDEAIACLRTVIAQEGDRKEAALLQTHVFNAHTAVLSAFDDYKQGPDKSAETGTKFNYLAERLLQAYYHAGRELADPNRASHWFAELNRIKFSLHSISKEIQAVQNPTEVLAKNWQDQLSDAANDLFGLEPEDNEAERRRADWIKEEIEKSRAIGKVRLRLLKRNEPFGVVTLPVLLGRSYVSDLAWARLKQHDFELDQIMYYPVIKNAKLVGIHQLLIPNPQGQQRSFGKIFDLLRKISRKVGGDVMRLPKDLVPVGPIINKGRHYYSLLLPHELTKGDTYRELSVQEWDFASRRIAESIQEDDTEDIKVEGSPQQFIAKFLEDLSD
jgi:hypothetical protein